MIEYFFRPGDNRPWGNFVYVFLVLVKLANSSRNAGMNMKPFFGALFLGSLVLTACASQTYAARRLDWALYQDGPTYLKIREAMPELHEQEEALAGGMGRIRTILSIAPEDLNLDDSPELIATAPRDYNLYGPDDPGDLHVIFRIKNDGSVQRVAEFTAHAVMLGDNYTHGWRDLLVFHGQDSLVYVLYSWSKTDQTYYPGRTDVLDPERDIIE